MSERYTHTIRKFDDEGYIKLVLPYITEERTQQERERIESALALRKGSTLLDVGCGNGRHAILLADSGYEVVGVDLSLALLEIAKGRVKQRRRAILLMQADMRHLPLINESIDGAYCVFSSFGFHGEEDDVRMLKEIARVLRGGGRFLLETFTKNDLSAVPYAFIWEDGKNLVIEDIWSFEGANNLLTVTRNSSALDQAILQIRLYQSEELCSMLSLASFDVVSITTQQASPGIPLQRLSLVVQRRIETT